MHTSPATETSRDWSALSKQIKIWGQALGFDKIGIADTDLRQAEPAYQDWIARGFHGEMDYMAKHGSKRSLPESLVPNTVRIITARMHYLPEKLADAEQVLNKPELAYISRYALGRDYHKVMRQRLQQLCLKMQQEIGSFGYRVFTDSAPVMEVALAEKSGLGWRGKHTLLLTRDEGSFFFLGEIYTDLPLPVDAPTTSHCGSCERCMDVCPTRAIIAPYLLDARRCISYLTIELKGSIPLEFRPLIGNRVYGCDDCQLFCPWNKYARPSAAPDFAVRHGLDQASLVELFLWDEATFQLRMQGSAIYRIGYIQWLRNLAVGLGNAPTTDAVLRALHARQDHRSEIVREHVLWAIQNHNKSIR